MSESQYPESFENDVRECLAHMYDFTAMQNDPIVQKLAPGLHGLESIQTARKILISTIEQLNQRDEANLQSKQARLYHILLLRYVEELPIQTVLQQLAISDRQYYRELQRAISVISQLLWERIQGPENSTETISLETEIQLASQLEGLVYTDLYQLLFNAVSAMTALAEQQGIIIDLLPMTESIGANVSENVLKQTVIYLLSELVKYTAADDYIEIEVRLDHARPIIALKVESNAFNIDEFQTEFDQNLTIAQLVQVMDGTLHIRREETPYLQIELILPQYERKLLVIDDNPDVANLIKRYLANTPYRVVDVQNPLKGLELARKLQPFTIMLDIMMPEWDGWEILQNLKSDPQTQAIPVLICSVLDTPELALSLGAEYYLKKPPDRVALLKILDQLE